MGRIFVQLQLYVLAQAFIQNDFDLFQLVVAISPDQPVLNAFLEVVGKVVHRQEDEAVVGSDASPASELA